MSTGEETETRRTLESLPLSVSVFVTGRNSDPSRLPENNLICPEVGFLFRDRERVSTGGIRTGSSRNLWVDLRRDCVSFYTLSSHVPETLGWDLVDSRRNSGIFEVINGKQKGTWVFH